MDTNILTKNLKERGFENRDVAEWINVTIPTVVQKIRGISFFTESEIEIISEKLDLNRTEKCKIFGTTADRKQRQKDLSLSTQLKKATEPEEATKKKIKKADDGKSANSDLLRQTISEKGDTVTSLSKHLGISRETLSRKISGAPNGNYKTGFSAKEISLIANRYSLSAAELKKMFGKEDAAAGLTFASTVIPESTVNLSGPYKNRPENIVATNLESGAELTFNTVTRVAEYFGATLAEINNRLSGRITKKDYILSRDGERWKVCYAGRTEPTQGSVDEKGAEI